MSASPYSTAEIEMIASCIISRHLPVGAPASRMQAELASVHAESAGEGASDLGQEPAGLLIGVLGARELPELLHPRGVRLLGEVHDCAVFRHHRSHLLVLEWQDARSCISLAANVLRIRHRT